jgi:hypothetical protein
VSISQRLPNLTYHEQFGFNHIACLSGSHNN